MLSHVFNRAISINRIIMTVITRVFSDPLGADQAVMAIGRHGEIRGTGLLGGAPVTESGAVISGTVRCSAAMAGETVCCFVI